jgi:hypothetical protein
MEPPKLDVQGSAKDLFRTVGWYTLGGNYRPILLKNSERRISHQKDVHQSSAKSILTAKFRK